MKVHQLSWQIPTSLFSKSVPDTQFLCVSLVSLQTRVQNVWYQLCSILLLIWLPPNKTSNLKSPVVQMTKRFHCTEGPQCAGFFFITHTAAWHRLWVSHDTIVWKGKQIQRSRVFFSLWSVFFSLCPEGLRDFPKVIWISLKGKGEKVGLWVTLKGSWLFRRRKKNPKISAYKELLHWEWISAYISPSPMETNRLKIQHVGIRLSTISKKEHL